MGADLPGEADVPPDHRDASHRDASHRDASHRDANHEAAPAARTASAHAEPRDRQQYYAELRVAVSREESVTAQRISATEQAATRKWTKDSSESRWLWTEYQRKWPPTDHPPPNRSKTLTPADNQRVEAECARIAERERNHISPAMHAIEAQDPDRTLVGLEHRRKSPDRLKEKVYDKMEELSFSPEEAISAVSDTIRYTFQYRETSYTQGVWADMERLREQGFELKYLKNSWSSEIYKGINSQWIEPASGQRFEVQFHTRISFEAKQLTHDAYERLRTHSADKFEQMVLEAFEKKVSAEVPVPLGAVDIPDYPYRGTDGR